MKGRGIIAAAAIVGAFTAGTVADGATGWKPFATGSDNSEYGAYVSASADVQKPKGLAIRGSRPGTLDWYVSCQGKRQVRGNQIVVVQVPGSAKCSFSGSLSTDRPGNAKVELLRR